jgi:hypothetical protein
VRILAVTVLAACALAVAAGCGSSSTAQQTSGDTQAAAENGTASLAGETVCVSQQEPGITADFGVRRSSTAAERLAAHAAKFGFQSLKVQRRACSRYAVVLTGLATAQQGHELQSEAARVGLHVRLECRSTPVRGGVAAVFGHRPKRRGAVVLMRRATARGFQDLQIQQDRCDDWEVDLYGLTTRKERAALRHEAAAAGYHVTFEPG